MNFFFQPRACQAEASDSKRFKDFRPRAAALAIGAVGAAMMLLVLASAATTFGDHRDEGGSVGASVRKGIGKCKAASAPAASAM